MKVKEREKEKEKVREKVKEERHDNAENDDDDDIIDDDDDDEDDDDVDDVDNDDDDDSVSLPEDGDTTKRKHKTPRDRQRAKGETAAKPIRSLTLIERDTEKSVKEQHAPSPQPEKVLYDNRIKRKNVLALNEKVAAIREYDKTPVYKRIGRMFHCSPDQIKRIVQQKDAIMKAWEQRTRRCQDARTLEMKVVRVSMLGKAVYDWIRRMMYYKDFMITDGLIQKMALQFKSAMGLQPFFPHQDWCNKFRQTYSIPESDSKLLHVGYTQGYSVQIKDIVKDVLNECTPDVVERRVHDPVDADGEPAETPYDDEGADVDVDGVGDIEQRDENDNNERARGKFAAPLRQKRIRIKQSPTIMAAATTNNTTTTTTALLPGGQGNKVALRLKMPIHKLLTLPLPKNGMQQVLVATPITTVAPRKAAGVLQGGATPTPTAVGNNAIGPAATPMTMTIIPLATIAAQSQNSPQPGAAAAMSTTTPAPGSHLAGIERQAGLMPIPLKEIKLEIKEEPTDVVEIKQEYISEDEGGDYGMNSCEETFGSNSYNLGDHDHDHTTDADDARHTGRRAQPFISISPIAQSLSSVSMASPATASRNDNDFENNVTLAELRDLIQKKATSTSSRRKRLFSSTTAVVESAITEYRSSHKQQQQRQHQHQSITPIPECDNREASFKPVKIPASRLSPDSMQPAMPPLIRAPTPAEASAAAPPPSSSTSSSPVATSAAADVRAQQRHKRLKTEDDEELAPIETYTEARRYIKRLESFALMKENFRLIGLLTRADEVLRELDGYGNTDSD